MTAAIGARARKPALLIVGCGDVGMRVLPLVRDRFRVFALTSSPGRHVELRAAGAVPLPGDLDRPASLDRIAGLADLVLHLAPPPGQGRHDPRTRALLQALARRAPPGVLVYASTSGVYGDRGGAWVSEACPPNPQSDRACRRVDAERQLRAWGQAGKVRVTLLRVPGIYAPDRAGARPQDRILRGTPSLRAEDDGYTNHIHADDLARACVLALLRGRPQRAIHVCDDADMKTGDYYDLVADLAGLPRLPRVARADAAALLSPMQWSFMNESRRLTNTRLKDELRLRLRWPTVADCLRATAAGAVSAGDA